MAAPRPTLGHYRGDSFTHAMLITVIFWFRPEGHREPCNEVGSLSQAEHPVGFEPGTFRFLSQPAVKVPFLRDCLPISLLMLSEFKRINYLLFPPPLKSPENCRFSTDICWGYPTLDYDRTIKYYGQLNR